MRIFLRLVAAYTFLSVVSTIRLLIHIWQQGGFLPLLKSGTFGMATMLGWLITLVAGVPGAVLLWRMRDLGRIATAIVIGSTGLYYLLCLALFRTPQTSYGTILFYVVFSGALVAIILSPAAGRSCRLHQLPEASLR